MLDPTKAQENADAAIARVGKSAEQKTPGWLDQAVEYIRAYSSVSTRTSFMTEDVREWAEAQGLPCPPDKRAWGAAVRTATRRGLIEMIGYGAQRSSNCHRSPKSIWRSARKLSWPTY
jgi:hypothetical protein